jgi:predicted metal-dependent hydrolase
MKPQVLPCLWFCVRLMMMSRMNSMLFSTPLTAVSLSRGYEFILAQDIYASLHQNNNKLQNSTWTDCFLREG